MIFSEPGRLNRIPVSFLNILVGGISKDIETTDKPIIPKTVIKNFGVVVS